MGQFLFINTIICKILLWGRDIYNIINSAIVLRLFIFRLLNKKNPFKGDLNHLHHLINNYTNNTNKTLMISAGLFILPYMLLINNFRTYNILFFTCLVYFCLITFLRFKNNK